MNAKITLIILAFLIVSTGAFASFGVSMPYSSETPLNMYAGEVKEVSFNLQNCPSKSVACPQNDETILASLIQGSEIAQIISGDEYIVPYGSDNTNIILKISAPASASSGSIYNIKFSVKSSPGEKGGNIQLGVAYNVGFPVVIVEKPALTPETPAPQPQSYTALIIILIIAIAIIISIIIWLIKRKKIS